MAVDDLRSRHDDLEALEHFNGVSRQVDTQDPPTFWGFSIRHVALVLLVCQNSSLILTMHYSRVVPVATGQRYLPSTAILLVEIIKLIFSLSMTLHGICENHPSKSTSTVFALVRRSVFSNDSWKLIIPAGLYTLQNALVYVAIGNLTAGTFQVTYQLKILTTVLFSILLLGKSISSRQWLALILLTLGVAIVQTSGPESTSLFSWTELRMRIFNLFAHTGDVEASTGHVLSAREGDDTAVKVLNDLNSSHHVTASDLSRPVLNASKGILAVIGASLTSGLTGVYFEKVVKDSLSSVSLWVRNVQLSFFSLFPALIIGVLWQDGVAISRDGFFVGYNWLVWTIIALQAFGGIMVAICITYAGNIAKNFAASVSIVTSCIASALIFDTPITLNFTFGTGIVLLAVHLYQSRNSSYQPVTGGNIKLSGKS